MIGTMDMNNLDLLYFYMVANKVKIICNMLHTTMKDRIFAQEYGSKIVTVNGRHGALENAAQLEDWSPTRFLKEHYPLPYT